jgi:hypothetical protein
MLRVLYILLEATGAICALLSPFIVIHWIFLATNLTMMIEMTAWFEGFIYPFNLMTETLTPFEMPSMNYGDGEVPMTQAITGGLFTVAFFVLTAGGRMLRKVEKEVDLKKKTWEEHQVQKKKQAKLSAEKRLHANFNEILVYVHFPFREFPGIGKVFYQFKDYNGRELPGNPDSLLIGFQDLEMALSFTIQLSTTLSNYYNKLSAADPKPPYFFTVHALLNSESAEDGLSTCAQLCKYAGDGQTLFSETVKRVLDAKDMTYQYKQHSLGFYAFPDGNNREVFVLHPVLPTNTMYY